MSLLLKLSRDLKQLNEGLTHALPQLKAIHVHHGLQQEADGWVAQCESVCQQLDVPLVVKRVKVDLQHSGGVEAAAREARYNAFFEVAKEGDVVALAHHAEDQLETLLFRMFRGTGIDGLAGMRPLSKKSGRLFWRPLLQESKQSLQAVVEVSGLQWIEDPSNQDQSFSRNYLRSKVTPPIVQRWPNVLTSASRLSEHTQEAIELHRDMAFLDKSTDSFEDWPRLARATLLKLSAARQKNLIRHSVQALDLPVPSEAQMLQILVQMVSQHSSSAVVSWSGAEVRMHRQILHFMAPISLFQAAEKVLSWDGSETLLLTSNGLLTTDGFPAGESFEVRYRQGGEKIHPHQKAHNKLLRRWLQEWEVPNWLRQRLPLIYYQGKFVAVPGWIDGQSCIWSNQVPESFKSIDIQWRLAAKS